MDYKARFYSPYINRFLQPDTIIPDLSNPQSWDRYSYVTNRPVNFSDPTGHRCAPEDDCAGWHNYDAVPVLKRLIKRDFGITMEDGGAEHPVFVDKKGSPTSRGQAWDLKNIVQVYTGLSNINVALRGRLKSAIGYATFTLNSHPISGKYYGNTSGQIIDFYVTSIMPLQNLYHEFGHVLNNLPEKDNDFSNALQNYENRSFILNSGDDAGQLDPRAFVSANVIDPNYGLPNPPAIQHASIDPREQWADIFANYVAGNIDLSKPTGPGIDMYDFIRGVFP
jgi:hypothetical protein